MAEIIENVIEVTEFELAECLGVSGRRIRQLAKQGVVVQPRRGRYNLTESVKGYMKMLKEGENKNDTLEKLKVSKEAEALTHERLKKRKTELQVLQLEKKMHTADDVEYFWNAMVLATKSKIMAIPVKCAPILVGLEDRREVQSILKREIDTALNELADYDVDMFESEFDDVFEE